MQALESSKPEAGFEALLVALILFLLVAVAL